MKKLLLIAGLAFGLVSSIFGASGSILVNQGSYTNFPTLIPYSSVKVSQIVIQNANALTNQTFLFFDSPTNTVSFTNATYTNTISYATNYLTTYTNYYGLITVLTNKALVDVTNNVVNGTTNNYAQYFSIFVPSNTSVTLPGLNQVFQYGIWITNSTPGTATYPGGTVTLTYTQ
jgi:hypothetical protein